MTSGKYFNRGVMSLDHPHIGFVVRETQDKIIVFGEGNRRYDIPISEIQTVGRNVLIGLNFSEIEKNFKVKMESPLPDGKYIDPWRFNKSIDLARYEGKFDKGLFNKGVRLANEHHVGHVMKDTDNKIVIFGDGSSRYDVPKSKIIAVGRNVILGLDWSDLFIYKVDRNMPLPTGESVDELGDLE